MSSDYTQHTAWNIEKPSEMFASFPLLLLGEKEETGKGKKPMLVSQDLLLGKSSDSFLIHSLFPVLRDRTWMHSEPVFTGSKLFFANYN